MSSTSVRTTNIVPGEITKISYSDSIYYSIYQGINTYPNNVSPIFVYHVKGSNPLNIPGSDMSGAVKQYPTTVFSISSNNLMYKNGIYNIYNSTASITGMFRLPATSGG
jgi:hypothetical protein